MISSIYLVLNMLKIMAKRTAPYNELLIGFELMAHAPEEQFPDECPENLQ